MRYTLTKKDELKEEGVLAFFNEEEQVLRLFFPKLSGHLAIQLGDNNPNRRSTKAWVGASKINELSKEHVRVRILGVEMEEV